MGWAGRGEEDSRRRRRYSQPAEETDLRGRGASASLVRRIPVECLQGTRSMFAGHLRFGEPAACLKITRSAFGGYSRRECPAGVSGEYFPSACL